MRALALLLLLALPAHAAPACAPGITAQLFFGRTSHGHVIGAAAWRDFLATSVTPRFPDGLTVIEATGQWRQRSTGRIIAEPSTIVEIVTDDSAETQARLNAIRADYKSRFAQESVGLVTTPSCASW